MNDNTPQPNLTSVLRDQAFDQIREISGLSESYARSIGEAAFRGDVRTVRAHLGQLRDCCVTMIQTYKDYLEGKDGAKVPAAAREDQRPGDGVA